MKKISMTLLLAFTCALVFAKGPDKPAPNASTVVVTNTSGSSLFKLHYQSGKVQTVKVSLFDNLGHEVFAEKLKNTDRFIRPYNFKNLPEGLYMFKVEDESGKVIELVDFTNVIKVDKWVKITPVKSSENKFELIVTSAKKEEVTIKVFDNEANVVYTETQQVENGFARVYNIKGLDKFSIEVTDDKGVIKEMKYPN